MIDLPIPPSANHLWRKAARSKTGRARTRNYDSWLSVAVPLMRIGLSVAKLPARVLILIRGGSGWTAGRDVANCEKAVVDALVHAQRIPDDSTAYVHEVRCVYLPPQGGLAAGCEVGFIEDKHGEGADMMEVDRQLLLAAQNGDLAAGAALLDRLRDARDARANDLNAAMGRLVHALKTLRGQTGRRIPLPRPPVMAGVAAMAVSPPDAGDAEGMSWAVSAEAHAAFNEYQADLAAIFWADLYDAPDVAEMQRFLDGVLAAESGDDEG